jgi:hypothetical protein
VAAPAAATTGASSQRREHVAEGGVEGWGAHPQQRAGTESVAYTPAPTHDRLKWQLSDRALAVYR